MRVYTYSEARQNLADLLDQAAEEGEVRIRRCDGESTSSDRAGVRDRPLTFQR
jgi:hypothetical protein